MAMCGCTYGSVWLCFDWLIIAMWLKLLSRLCAVSQQCSCTDGVHGQWQMERGTQCGQSAWHARRGCHFVRRADKDSLVWKVQLHNSTQLQGMHCSMTLLMLPITDRIASSASAGIYIYSVVNFEVSYPTAATCDTKWGWNLAWRSQLLHARCLSRWCRGGAFDPKSKFLLTVLVFCWLVSAWSAAAAAAAAAAEMQL